MQALGAGYSGMNRQVSGLMQFTCPNIGSGQIIKTSIISDSDMFYKENKIKSFGTEDWGSS